MTRDEFAATCAAGGYASRKAALTYAGNRDELTEDDIIEVYRLNEHPRDRGDWRNLMAPDGSRVRTTKKYIRTGSDGREE